MGSGRGTYPELFKFGQVRNVFNLLDGVVSNIKRLQLELRYMSAT